MSTADAPETTVAELSTACYSAADRHGRAPADVSSSDTAFFAGYLVSALTSLTAADPTDTEARVHAARAIAAWVAAHDPQDDPAEWAFSGLTASERRRLVNLLERVGR